MQEDRAGDYDIATAVFGQWTRAEPDFRQKTAEEYEAEQERWWADLDARVKAETAQQEKERAERKGRHDPERAHARLALLEQQASLAGRIRERDEIAARERFPAMPDDRRRAQLTELERTIATARAALEDLNQRVGDPEVVVDERGWLPSERRELALDIVAARRNTEVRELRERIASQEALLKTTRGRPERASIRDEIRKATDRRAFLEAIPPMTAPDMCSECSSPAAWHDTIIEFTEAGPERGPCPAWPLWSQRLQKTREAIMALVTRSALPQPPPAPEPSPQPIAVIAAGLPIEEVITQLTAAQASHPGAKVRRGKRNRWEIGPE